MPKPFNLYSIIMGDHTHDDSSDRAAEPVESSSHNGQHGHDHDATNCRKCQAPSGSSSYGWLWVVGIIVVVAIALYFLQRNVPEVADDAALLETDTTEETAYVAFTEPGVYKVSVPTNARTGGFFGVDWAVFAPEATTIEHTSVRWGLSSKASFEDYPNRTTDFDRGSFDIPGVFEANVAAPEEEGVVYLRAYAVIDGVDYQSEEFTVNISR